MDPIIQLVIAVAVLAVVYIAIQWFFGQTGLPGPWMQIIQIIFAAIVIILLLRLLWPMLAGA